MTLRRTVDFSDEIAAEVDQWADTHDTSGSAAIRHLVALGLRSDGLLYLVVQLLVHEDAAVATAEPEPLDDLLEALALHSRVEDGLGIEVEEIVEGADFEMSAETVAALSRIVDGEADPEDVAVFFLLLPRFAEGVGSNHRIEEVGV